MNSTNNYAWEEQSHGRNCYMFSPSFNSSSVILKNTLILTALNELFKQLQNTLIKSIFPMFLPII